MPPSPYAALASLAAVMLTGCSHADDSAAGVAWGPVIDSPALVVYEGTPLDALSTGAVCSASVADGIVITAAHCLSSGSVDVVVLPEGNCEAEGATRLEVGEPYYIAGDGDLAIMPVEGEADIASTVSINSSYSVFGWAKVQSSGIRECGLHVTEVNIVAESYCSESDVTVESTSGGTICAQSSGWDVCSGDSGGPLIDAEGRIAAVVSRGEGCQENGYTEYAAVCPFIDSVIPGACSAPSASVSSGKVGVDGQVREAQSQFPGVVLRAVPVAGSVAHRGHPDIVWRLNVVESGFNV